MKLIAFLRSKLIKDFSYAFLGNLLYAGLIFVANALIARELGPAKFGDFSLLYAILYMITIFSDFGLSISIAKFLPEYYSHNQNEKAENLLNISFKIKIIGSSAIAIIGIIFSNIISINILRNSSLLGPLIVVFFGGIGLSLYELLSTYLQAKQKFLNYSLYISMRALLILGLITLLVFFSSLSILSTIIIFSLVPSVIFLFAFFSAKGFNISLRTEKKDFKEFIKFNIYIIIANIANVVISRIDLFYINIFLDSESVGFYSVANQLLQIVTILTTSITIILLPKVASLTSFTKIKESFYKILKYSSILYLGVFPLILVAPFIINLIYSASYTPSILLFQLLVLAFGLSFIINPLSTLVYKFNKSKIIAIMVVARLGLILIFEPIFLIFFQLNGIGLVYILNLSFALAYIISYLYYYIHKKEISN